MKFALVTIALLLVCTNVLASPLTWLLSSPATRTNMVRFLFFLHDQIAKTLFYCRVKRLLSNILVPVSYLGWLRSDSTFHCDNQLLKMVKMIMAVFFFSQLEVFPTMYQVELTGRDLRCLFQPIYSTSWRNDGPAQRERQRFPIAFPLKIE